MVPAAMGLWVHGLWPQFERGWPQACAGAGLDIPAPLRRDILEIMPSERLVSHEWRTHGTCSGLTAPKYFESILSAWADVRIPPAAEESVGERGGVRAGGDRTAVCGCESAVAGQHAVGEFVRDGF